MTNVPTLKVKTFKEFLESTPPGKLIEVSDLIFTNIHQMESYISPPQLSLYCSHTECMGNRFFKAPEETNWMVMYESNNTFVTYSCQNCGEKIKTFSINVIPLDKISGKVKARVLKYGELPQFGQPIPSRAFKLIGTDKDLFLTGRRAENQGMGIGAFTYYRRVVENQKDRIFDEIIRVTNKISPDDPIIEELKQAKRETQFTKAVGEIKHGLPSSLQINGQNPLTLLHSALSEGVHDHDDKECLELAGDIRNVLFEFADKLAYALKEDTELNASVSRLIKAKGTKKNKDS